MNKIDKHVRKVYDALFETLYREHNDTRAGYEHLLQFLAADNCPPIINDIEGRLEWFFSNPSLAEKLIRQYDLGLIKSSRYDYLGDLYLENVISTTEVSRKGLMLTPQPIVELMCQMTIGKTDDKLNILDPCVGTGRFLLTANIYAPNAALFGVDNNITIIRTAFTNAAIHSVTMYLLNADSLKHETDISKPEGMQNWHYANRWQSHMHILKPIRPLKLRKYDLSKKG